MVQFRTAKLLSTIFTPDFSLSDRFSVIRLFKDLSGNRFDGELLSLPVPSEAPAEIPRIVMQSKDGNWKLEISLERTNLMYLLSKERDGTAPSIPDFGVMAEELFCQYVLRTGIRVQRLAFVTERFTEIDDKSPAEFIADTYCRENYLKAPFNNVQSFELHALKKYRFMNFNLNSWVRLKSAELIMKSKLPIFLVINDVNTLSKQEQPDISFSEDDMKRFFIEVPGHVDEILSLYLKKD